MLFEVVISLLSGDALPEYNSDVKANEHNESNELLLGKR
jgi:hypothetical protein